jgi:polyisoprenyl-teichoic acid--peptidoglycan teichoic acid transferase
MPPTRSGGPPLFTIAAFWLFVVGGLIFGGVFLSNWKALGRRPQSPSSPPVAMNVPVIGTVPITGPPGLPLPRPQVPVPPVQVAPPKVPEIARNLLPEWTGTDRINIALLGIDKRDDETVEGTRSDTIIVASIDPPTRSVAMVSIPRDLWVTIPGCNAASGCIGGQQRINFAHALGGPDLLKRTISTDFGVPIQYYARVDFRGFEQMVDAVDGVIIDVERPIKDDEYPTYDYGFQRLYVTPGPQWMDGPTALKYARSRHDSTDFSRAARQQKVLVSLRDRALQLNMLPKAPELLGIASRSLSTDLSPVQLLSLARLLSEVNRDHIANVVLDTHYVTGFIGPDGASLLRADPGVVRRAIDGAERAAARPELRARIEVLNGSGRAGLGQKAADYLTAQGFNVVQVALADRADYRSSMVQVLTASDDHRAAEALASMLQVPSSAISDVPTPDAAADVRLVVGRDFQQVQLQPPSSGG